MLYTINPFQLFVVTVEFTTIKNQSEVTKTPVYTQYYKVSKKLEKIISMNKKELI